MVFVQRLLLQPVVTLIYIFKPTIDISFLTSSFGTFDLLYNIMIIITSIYHNY